MKRNWIPVGAAVVASTVGILSLSSRTAAATATANLSVSASVANNCTISTGAVAFGAYDPVVANASADLDGTGSVTIACTKGATTSVELDLGANASGSTRQLEASSNYLTYQLYQDSGRTTVWGTGTDKNDTGVAPSKAARAFTVYGRVPAGQDVPAESYSDTVVATVNF